MVDNVQNSGAIDDKTSPEELIADRTLDIHKLLQAIDQSHNTILITDLDGNIEFINHAFTCSTGYTQEEVIHQNARILQSGYHDGLFYQEMWDTLTQGRVWEGELLNKRKDGSLYWDLSTTSPVKDEDGHVTHFVAFREDITERKKEEDKLRRSNTVVEKSPAVLFRWKAAEGWPVELVSSNVKQFGYSRKEFLSGELTYSSIVHSEDLDRITSEVEKYSTSGRDTFTQEYRIVSPTGKVFWVDGRTTIERDDDRNITCYQGIILDITEHKAVEQALIESESQQKIILHTIPDMIWVKDVDGGYVSCNPNFEQFIGDSEPNIIGKTDDDFFPPELIQRFYEQDQAVINKNEIVYSQYRVPARNGDGWWTYDVTKSPLRTSDGTVFGVLGIARDVTQQHRQKLKLEESREQLSLALEAANLGLWDWRPQSDELYTSDTYLTMLGYHPEDFPETTERWSSLVHPDDLLPTLAILKPFVDFNDSLYCSEHRLRTVDGKWRWIMDVGRVISRNSESKAERFMGVHIDITEKKKLEHQLVRARQQADTANQAKSSFLANMSHEIRTPMNSIIGMSQLALDSNLNPNQRNYVEKAHRSAKLLLGIINDILDFSKIEADKLEFEITNFWLPTVFDELSTILEFKATERGLEFEIDVSPDVPKVLKGDPLRLRQILLNLSNNAIKFTEQGSVTISVDVAEQQNNLSALKFCVRDTGIGISKEQQSKLFQPFTQADSSTTRHFGGTGLGLTISRQLVELMGGEIWVKSEPKHGSRFYFTVQMERGDISELQYDKYVDCSEAIAHLHGARVLLVEDNRMNLELATALLCKQGIQVTQALNGQEALEILKIEQFDGVLMDLQMPVMDGYSAAREIRKQPQFKDLPIIAMTANVMKGDREKAEAVGMNDHISKPLIVDKMFTTMSRWITPINAEVERSNNSENYSQYASPLQREEVSQADSEKGKESLKKSNLYDGLIGIDVSLGLLRTMNDHELYSNLLTWFYDDHSSFEEAFKSTCDNKDIQAATRTVHTLKGGAGSIGAIELQQAAEQLEIRCGSGSSRTLIYSALQQVIEELNPVLKGLEYFQSEPSVKLVLEDSINQPVVFVEGSEEQNEDAIETIKNEPILIVDDTPGNLKLLEATLMGKGYTNLVFVQDPREVVKHYQNQRSSLILLDISMPYLDGYQVMDKLKALNDPLLPPIIILTAKSDDENLLKALAVGARDYVTKPFNPNELVMRVRNLLDVHQVHRFMHDKKSELEKQVTKRTNELRSSQLDVVQRLGRAAEYRDEETGNHILRMSHISLLLAQGLGWSESECELILNASAMHDIGKIGIPDHILLKSEQLESHEWEIMKSHVTIGAKLLDNGESKLMHMAHDIVLTHHEKWDGSGYPNGLAGEEIPQAGRIAALADVIDALTSRRPYKEAWPIEKAVKQITDNSGLHFDPELVEVLLIKLPSILKVLELFPEPQMSK